MQKSVCKWMLLSLCSWMFLSSCTDSDYDLNDVTKDGMVIGEVLSGGLGHGSISAEKFLNADKIDGLTVKDGNYVISYKDSVKVSLDYDVPAGATGDLGRTFPIVKQSVKLKGLDELFQGDSNVLSFVDPRVKLTAYSKAGTPLNVNLTFESVNESNGKKAETNVNFRLNDPASPFPKIDTSKIWIGADLLTMERGYKHTPNYKLNDLLNITPSLINLSGSITTDVTPTSKGAYTQIIYEVEVPLAPSPSPLFKAKISETMEDVFSEDLIDLLFASGEVELLGTVSNGMPLDLSLNLIITDEKGKPVGIDFGKRDIESFASKAPVSFTITENDIRKKMAEAKGIILEFEATGSEKAEGRCIRPDQKVELVLNFFKKTGGIKIDTL
ncbi:hypothetical protein Barb4_03224 [Bacteroidales bacterium Barb4]|nr:hypothetical protein Barb4_03224 [Bacteroidales bacterium Barb4]